MYLDDHMLVKAPRTTVVAMQRHPEPPAFKFSTKKASGEWMTTGAYVCVPRWAVPGGVLQNNVAEAAG